MLHRQPTALRVISLISVPLLFAPNVAAQTAPLLVASVAVRGTQATGVKLETQAGHSFDTEIIDHDVKRLWETGRFSDIKVESEETPKGAAVIFQVVENPRLKLHEVQIQPQKYGLRISLPEGIPMTQFQAHRVAIQAQDELLAKGYIDAHVDSELVPVTGNNVDLKLKVEASDPPIRVTKVEFTGNHPGVTDKELRKSLQALRIRKILPKLPGMRANWRMLPSYSVDAVDADLARVDSLFMTKGYFDAKVRLDNADIDGRDATIRIFVDSGPMYTVQNQWGKHQLWSRDLCSCLFKQRREAEKSGILDFQAHVQVQPKDDHSADLAIKVEEGRPYRVGRIEFNGLRHYSEAAVRKNFVLDESDVFDEQLLRESIYRLNQSMMFDPVDMRNVSVRTDDKTGVADIVVPVNDRKRGSWMLSGPVGPASFAGPLEASIQARLPSWGRGIFELSTYSASVSMFAFAGPIAPLLGLGTKATMFPIIMLRRPYTPGEGWLSGFSYMPQLGWQYSALGYLTSQIEHRAIPLLDGSRHQVPELVVSFDTEHSSGPMFCAPPKPRLNTVRRIGALGLEFMGAMTSF